MEGKFDKYRFYRGLRYPYKEKVKSCKIMVFKLE